jgi:hypothetical protein
VFCQEKNENNKDRKHFIGSTFFMLSNFSTNETPNYYQLNYGYRITPKDVISIEAITWNYYEPIGIPYGSEKTDANNNFPGKVKAYGLGFAYKRFLWKGVYTQFHSTAFKQNYMDKNNKKIQSGFQLFNTLRFGYHFKLFKNRMFIEPSIAFTSWPINTNLPESFQIKEDKWNNFFLFEPGLHFGINFW